MRASLLQQVGYVGGQADGSVNTACSRLSYRATFYVGECVMPQKELAIALARTNSLYIPARSPPKERVQILPEGSMDTLQRLGFLTEAKKSKQAGDPLAGEKVEQIVGSFFKLTPAIVHKLKDALNRMDNRRYYYS